MTKRLTTLLLAVILSLWMALPAFAEAAPDPMIVADLYQRANTTVDLYDAIIHKGSLARSSASKFTFYSDAECKNKVVQEQRLTEDTQFWVRGEVRSYDPQVESFWVYVTKDITSFELDAAYTSADQPIKLTAYVSRRSGHTQPSGFVEFYENGNLIATNQVSPSGKATAIMPYAIGTHYLHAVYLGDNSYDPARAEMTLTVTATSAAAGPATTAPATESIPTAYNATQIQEQARDAIATAKNNGLPTACLSVNGTGKVDKELLSALDRLATESGQTLKVNFDRRDENNRLLTRLYTSFGTDSATGASSGFTPDASLTGPGIDSVTASFSKYFFESVSAAYLSQEGDFGFTAHFALAIKVNAQDPHFYLYNTSANSYAPITGYIDSAGYIHVQVTKGGYVVVSDGPLTK